MCLLSLFALFYVEGGHRTMTIMKFMSGLQLNSLSPQYLSMCNNQQKMPKSLPQQGFAQTCYSIHIADIKMPIAAFAKYDVSALSNFSEIIKMRQKTRVVSKWLNVMDRQDTSNCQIRL